MAIPQFLVSRLVFFNLKLVSHSLINKFLPEHKGAIIIVVLISYLKGRKFSSPKAHTNFIILLSHYLTIQ